MDRTGSQHLVDPELLGLLRTFPDFALTSETLSSVRALTRPTPPVAPEALARVERAVHQVPGREGHPDVGVIVYRPFAPGAPRGCILHMHGGGYVMGRADANEAVHRAVALALNCVIVTVDYRLAPETRAPGAVEDCYAALAWVLASADELGVDASRVGVAGESAGGGLAASLALLVRDRGEYRLAFQHLIYPMIDDRTCVVEPGNPFAGEFVWTPDKNSFGWASLLGHEPGAPGVSPYAAAARAADLAGLPPTFIAVGSLDLFVDEDLDYARRLVGAGVPTELHVYPGAFHGFHFDPSATVTRRANRDSLDALRRALASRSG